MQKETKNILWVAVVSFFSGVIVTFALLYLALAMTRPCPKMMGTMPMHGMQEIHRQGFAPRAESQNHTRGLKRAPHVKEGMKRPDSHEHRPAPEQK